MSHENDRKRRDQDTETTTSPKQFLPHKSNRIVCLFICLCTVFSFRVLSLKCSDNITVALKHLPQFYRFKKST